MRVSIVLTESEAKNMIAAHMAATMKLPADMAMEVKIIEVLETKPYYPRVESEAEVN